ncbi:hypothetical protein P4V41_07890 [Fictibacillus nanhaiensis]|uniref:hypothetical protein n=1 Tax=Fictibacillus nanhaiensis TaxID=742169 RepID=UPI002E228C17|nr:hypothetical protein [Fictibacillus nanhaiensis]
MTTIILCSLISFIILLLFELRTQKKEQYSKGYWKGVEDTSVSYGMLFKAIEEEEFDETTKDYE